MEPNQPDAPNHEIILQSPRRRDCAEFHLVLVAVGIDAQIVHQAGSWLLIVAADQRDAAANELQRYRDENPKSGVHPVAARIRFPGAIVGVVAYSAVLILFACFSEFQFGGRDWDAAGQMHAASVVAGQWWRTVTALTLHADIGHLASNLVFGAVFGVLAGRAMGGGVAWLLIVISGTIGNAINALVQQPDHRSIGASTAVFSALGLLVANGLMPRLPSRESAFRRWSPLVGGVLLLAFVGVGGERTDVVAHTTGGVAGLVVGLVAARLPNAWLLSLGWQATAGVAAVLLVVASWVLAIELG